MSFIKRHSLLIMYGLSLAALLLLLKMTEYHLLIIDHSTEIYTGAVALIFMALGIWLAVKLMKPKKEIRIIEKEKVVEKETIIEKERIIEKEVFIKVTPQFQLNEKAITDLEISPRELEVLQLMAKGLSNQEIAAQLFVSVNTVKTHIANLFFKLDATRRTQAIEKAKTLSIIP